MIEKLAVFDFFASGRDLAAGHVLMRIAEPSAPHEKERGYFFAMAEITGGTREYITKLQAAVDAIESDYYAEKNKGRDIFERILVRANETYAELLPRAGVGLHLAAACPDLVSGLVLLDPAIGLNGERMLAVAEAMLESPDYPDPEEARAEKVNAAWADVPAGLIDDELDEHLVELPSGRYRWRICVPAMMSYWSELARDIVLPRNGTPTTVLQGALSDPPYVGRTLINGLSERLGSDFTLTALDCRHMVPLAKPVETAAAIRDMLARG